MYMIPHVWTACTYTYIIMIVRMCLCGMYIVSLDHVKYTYINITHSTCKY